MFSLAGPLFIISNRTGARADSRVHFTHEGAPSKLRLGGGCPRLSACDFPTLTSKSRTLGGPPPPGPNLGCSRRPCWTLPSPNEFNKGSDGPKLRPLLCGVGLVKWFWNHKLNSVLRNFFCLVLGDCQLKRAKVLTRNLICLGQNLAPALLQG